MKKNIYLLIVLAGLCFACSEQAKKKTPAPAAPSTETKHDVTFNPDTRKQLGIDYPVTKIYPYSDNSGNYHLVLTETNDGVTAEKDTLHLKIKAFNFKESAAGLEKQWEVTDFTLPKADDYDGEETIWFWTKYLNVKDIDKDGLADVILVYGTNALNGYDDGRIKIILWHKGDKIAIRHQNGVLDDERNTQVDAKFYTLPAPLQDHVKALMDKMDSDRVAIFPYGWQEAMKAHKLKFDEN
jgi:hypothetical protein